jgi:hypothetical protein
MLDMFVSGLMFHLAGLAFSGIVVLIVYLLTARSQSRYLREMRGLVPLGRALCV